MSDASYLDKVGTFFYLMSGRIGDKLSDKSWSYAEYRELLTRLRDWCDTQLRDSDR